MAKTWIKNGVTASGILRTDNSIIINARDEQWIAEGWVEYTPPQPSAEEVAMQEAKKEMDDLLDDLCKLDYKGQKYIDGCYTEEEYAPIKAERQAKRDRINELEVILGIKK